MPVHTSDSLHRYTAGHAMKRRCSVLMQTMGKQVQEGRLCYSWRQMRPWLLVQTRFLSAPCISNHNPKKAPCISVWRPPNRADILYACSKNSKGRSYLILLLLANGLASANLLLSLTANLLDLGVALLSGLASKSWERANVSEVSMRSSDYLRRQATRCNKEIYARQKSLRGICKISASTNASC